MGADGFFSLVLGYEGELLTVGKANNLAVQFRIAELDLEYQVNEEDTLEVASVAAWDTYNQSLMRATGCRVEWENPFHTCPVVEGFGQSWDLNGFAFREGKAVGYLTGGSWNPGAETWLFTRSFTWEVAPLAPHLRAITVGTEKPVPNEIPAGIWLGVPYPHPIKNSAELSLVVGRRDRILVEIFDLLGRSVGVLYNGSAVEGTLHLHLEVGNLSNGVYLLRATGEMSTFTRKVVLSR